MSSLFHRSRTADPGMLKVPSECVLGGGSEALRAKRDAQLKWMRERGVRYLGNPMVWPDRRAPGSPIAPSRELSELRAAANDRPGDEIVRDLASAG